MPLEIVKRSCGHTEQIKTFGTPREQRYQLARALNTPCSRCKPEKRSEVKKPSDLPDLVGSPAQITWAEKIRQKVSREIKKEIKALSQIAKETKDPRVSGSIMRLRRIMDETSARRWIDNRDVWINIIKGD
jgi:hypothetical protein